MPARARAVDGFPLSIVGESHYLENFVAAFGPRRPEGIAREADATIEYEDENPYDPLAVVVKIDGRDVGYLSRIDARLFRQAMKRCGCSARVLSCAAYIRGGWDDGCGDEGCFSVALALDTERPVD